MTLPNNVMSVNPSPLSLFGIRDKFLKESCNQRPFAWKFSIANADQVNNPTRGLQAFGELIALDKFFAWQPTFFN